MSGGEGLAVGGRLYPLLGLFGVAVSPQSVSHSHISFVSMVFFNCKATLTSILTIAAIIAVEPV